MIVVGMLMIDGVTAAAALICRMSARNCVHIIGVMALCCRGENSTEISYDRSAHYWFLSANCIPRYVLGSNTMLGFSTTFAPALKVILVEKENLDHNFRSVDNHIVGVFSYVWITTLYAWTFRDIMTIFDCTS